MRPVKILVAMSAMAYASAILQAAEPESFLELLERYEQIRLSLLADHVTDVQENAMAIARYARELADDFDAETAGLATTDGEAARTALDEIAGAASGIAGATDLEQIRGRFFELSKPMGRYRKLTGDTSTIVVYCPMAKKAWLQPDSEIGNPYYGQAMPKCGNHIPD